MLSYLSGKDIPVILMHINGRPKTMQNNPVYDDLIKDISKFFLKQCNIAMENGIKKNHIILDPGIGFGKSFEDNFTLIRKLNDICDLGYPVMIGPSRKAFIGDALDLSLNERIEGTLATVVAGIMNGAKIVRVHDVKEVKRAVKITEKILASA
jgi:dihydropteroate synthase